MQGLSFTEKGIAGMLLQRARHESMPQTQGQRLSPLILRSTLPWARKLGL